MNTCLNCGVQTTNPSFCSRSCSASFNNRGVRRHGTGLIESICPTCGSKFSGRKGQKYCCRKCSFVKNETKSRNVVGCKNRIRKKTVKSSCIVCGSDILSNIHRKYCSTKCQSEYNYSDYIDKYKKGLVDGSRGVGCISRHLIRYIRETLGTCCSVCGWDERHPVDGAILTEIDHIDGNASNNEFSNFRILCPNCHSMTSTYRARNKNSARTNRKK